MRLSISLCSMVILIVPALVDTSQAVSGGEVLTGRVEIADPNIMRGLGGFSIRVIGFSNERHESTSHIKSTETDEDGQFEIEVTDFGTAVAAFSKDRKVVGWSWIEPGKSSVVIPLTLAVSLSGRLIWDHDDQPLSGHVVNAMTPMAPRGSSLRSSLGTQTTTDDQGRFLLTGLLPGIPYHVSVGVRVIDPAEAVGISYQRLVMFESRRPEAWQLPVRRCVGERGRIERIRPLVAIGADQPAWRPETDDAATLFRKAFEDADTAGSCAMVYFRNGRAGEDVPRMDQFVGEVQKLLGNRLPLVVLDRAQDSSADFIETLHPKHDGLPWIAAVNSDQEVIAALDDRAVEACPLFHHSWQYWYPDSPPEAEQLLKLVQLAVPDVSREELLQVAALLGYADLPILAEASEKR